MERNATGSTMLKTFWLKTLWLAVGVVGFAAVVLGALGAHAAPGLDGRLASMLSTATAYHLPHAVAAGVAAGVATLDPERSRLAMIAGAGFVCGILLFSGSLYAHAFSGGATPTALAPFGGGAVMASWIALGIAGARAIGRISRSDL